MMRYAVGYQFREAGEESIADIVRDFRQSIGEVYFAWLDSPSARSPATDARGMINWAGQAELETDLRLLRDMGIRLDLLFNASCYGRESLSQYLANFVCSVVAHLRDQVGLDMLTTTSLMIAEVIKENFPELEVRASVNMRVGTVKALECLADLFDSFCMQREFNRDLRRVAELSEWCDAHGKKLCMLANSGCLNYCPAQAFHDNLVAHAREVDQMSNLPGLNPVLCRRHYADPAHWVSCLQNSWVRPEDIDNYEDAVDTVKLATRTHANPRKVIQAYAERRFDGNLLDLLEPGYGPEFLGHVIDNTRFPADWFERTTSCDKRCHRCSYCESVLKDVLVRV